MSGLPDGYDPNLYTVDGRGVVVLKEGVDNGGGKIAGAPIPPTDMFNGDYVPPGMGAAVGASGPSWDRTAGSNREAWDAPPPGMLTQPGGRGGMPANAVAPRFGVSAAPQLFRDRNAKPAEPKIRTQSAWAPGLPPGLAAAGQRRMDYGAGEDGSMQMQKPVFKPGLGGGSGTERYGMANIPVKR